MTVLFLCPCCTDHHGGRVLWESVTCSGCGQRCSCEGCVAEDLRPEDEWAQFDAQSRRYLRVSGEEFIRGWKSGAYDDRAEDPDVARVVMLLPDAPA